MSAAEAVQSTAKPASSNSPSLLLQGKCACGGSAGLSGECNDCHTQRLLGKPLQAKLRIGAADDEFEREADRVADQVMQMPDATVRGEPIPQPAPLVQRRAASSAPASIGAVPSIVHDVLTSPGQPLDVATRTFFEPRFGHDFANVRVHTDAKAAQSARAVNALAYTVGNRIVTAGPHLSRPLLAHELTHVVQQGFGNSEFVQRAPSCGASLQSGDHATLLELIFDDRELRAIVHFGSGQPTCELPASFNAPFDFVFEADAAPRWKYTADIGETFGFSNVAGLTVTVQGLATLPIPEGGLPVRNRIGTSGPDASGELPDASQPIPVVAEGDVSRPEPKQPSESEPGRSSQEPPVDGDIATVDLTDQQRTKLQALQSLGGSSESMRGQLDDLNEALRLLSELQLPGGIDKERLLPIPPDLLPVPDALVLLGGILHGASARSEVAADACAALLEELDALFIEIGTELAKMLAETAVAELLSGGMATGVAIWRLARRVDKLRKLLDRLDALVRVVNQVEDAVSRLQELPQRYRELMDRYEELARQLDTLQGNFDKLSQADTAALFESVDMEREMAALQTKIGALLREKLGAEELTDADLEELVKELPQGLQALADTLNRYRTPTTAPDRQDIIFNSAYRAGSLLHPVVAVLAAQAAAGLGSISVAGARKSPGNKAGRSGKRNAKRAKDAERAEAGSIKNVSQAELRRLVAKAAAEVEAAFASPGAAYIGKDGTRYWSDTWFRVFAHMALAKVNESAKSDPAWAVWVGEGKDKRKKQLADVARFKLKGWDIGRDDASVDIKLNPDEDARLPRKDDVILKTDAPEQGIAVPTGKYAALQEAAIAKEFNHGRPIEVCAEAAGSSDQGVCRDGDVFIFGSGSKGEFDNPIPIIWPKRSIDDMNSIRLWPEGAGNGDKVTFNPREQKTISTSSEQTQAKLKRLDKDIGALTTEIAEIQASLAAQGSLDAASLRSRESELRQELAAFDGPLGAAGRAVQQLNHTNLKKPPSEKKLLGNPALQAAWDAYSKVQAEKQRTDSELNRTLKQLGHFTKSPQLLAASQQLLAHMEAQRDELQAAPLDRLSVGLSRDSWPEQGKKLRRVKAHSRQNARKIMTIFQRQLEAAGLEVPSSAGTGFVPAASTSLHRNYQVDHVIDLAMSGRDRDDNLWPITTGQNASIADVHIEYGGKPKVNLATDDSLVGKWFVIMGFSK